jgi:hypothetical protein
MDLTGTRLSNHRGIGANFDRFCPSNCTGNENYLRRVSLESTPESIEAGNCDGVGGPTASCSIH